MIADRFSETLEISFGSAFRPVGKPHPMALRARVVAFVEEGNSHREAVRHFRVSPRLVNNMMILHRSSGSLAPAKQGQPLGSKLSVHGAWISQRVSVHGEVTLDEPCVELAEHGCHSGWLKTGAPDRPAGLP